ncbi:hypothetical protein GCM10022286_07610 [Gryllotalpicola daejeonensis]|uniref:DUF8094 domain-containing protein n=1 Tax=Gryllotalpicola daejeonensis TaxID=993087 RepID=A0ABP7ZGL6_9MICO
MRFVIAIAAFLIAAIMIGVGVAQRTIWAPAASVTAAAEVHSHAPYIVISGATLNANEGQQTLRVTGASNPFVAYGRTADVKAWIGDEPYTRVSYDQATQSLKSTLVRPGDHSASESGDATATPTPTSTPTASATPTAGASAKTSELADSIDPKAPNPAGSDLWLEEFTGAKAATTTMNVPDSVSVIIATDGAHEAPAGVSLTWPMDTRTPWAGPLIVLGGLLAIAGIVFYILALRHMRRGRGPRRGGSNGRPQRLPRAPRAARVRSVGPAAAETHGRRSLGRGLIAVPVLLAGAVTMAGCSSDYWPAIGANSASPTPTASPIATQLPGQGTDRPAPAVTEPQLRNIVTRIAETAKTADANKDAALAATRFTGSALLERQTNYRIRQKLSTYAAPTAIPVNPKLSIVLPQATATWPRAVDVIVSDPATKNAAPIALTLTQASPRDNYKVAYSMYMLAGAKIPNLAPADIGATSVPPDSKLLKVPTSQVAQDYADVIALGAKSKKYDEFDESPNSLIQNFGAQNKADLLKKFQKTAGKMTFADRPSADAPVSLATNNAGALVATTIEEVQTARTTDPLGTMSAPSKSGTAALTGKTSSHKGFETTYDFQLLLYVPPAESQEKIRLLGYTAAVTGSVELK